MKQDCLSLQGMQTSHEWHTHSL